MKNDQHEPLRQSLDHRPAQVSDKICPLPLQRRGRSIATAAPRRSLTVLLMSPPPDLLTRCSQRRPRPGGAKSAIFHSFSTRRVTPGPRWQVGALKYRKQAGNKSLATNQAATGASNTPARTKIHCKCLWTAWKNGFLLDNGV